MLTPNDCTKNQRSLLLYAETCCVDGGGMMEGRCINAQDREDLDWFQGQGYLVWGRIPTDMLDGAYTFNSHFVALSSLGWALATDCRKLRAQQHGPFATQVWARVAQRKEQETESMEVSTEHVEAFMREFAPIKGLVEEPLGRFAAGLLLLPPDQCVVANAMNTVEVSKLVDACRSPCSMEVFQHVAKHQYHASEDEQHLDLYDTLFGRIAVDTDRIGVFCSPQTARAILRYRWEH